MIAGKQTAPDKDLAEGAFISRKRAHIAALVSIMVMGAALRFLRLGRESLWFDELYNVMIDKFPLGELLREAIVASHPPLYYLASHVWYALGGYDEFWVRSFSAFSGLAAVIFTYLAGRRLFSISAGLWGGAFVAASPFLIWYSRAANYYSFLVAVSALSFYMLTRASLDGGWKNWLGYIIATLAVFATYFYGVVLALAGLVAFLLLRGRSRGRALPLPMIASQWVFGVAAIVSYWVTSRWSISETGAGLGFPEHIADLVSSVIFSPIFLLMGQNSGFFDYAQIEKLTAPRALFLGAMVIAGLVAAVTFRRRLLDKKLAAVAAYTFLLVVGVLILYAAGQGMLSVRFYVWAAPTFLLLIGALIAMLPGRFWVWAAGMPALVFLIIVSLWQVAYPTWNYGDWRQIFAAVESERQEGDRMLCLPIYNCAMAADYYLSGAMPVTGGIESAQPDAIFFLPPGETWGGYRSGFWGYGGGTSPLSGDELQQRISAEINGARRIWLITAAGALERDPAFDDILEHEWSRSEQWDYNPFTLMLYEPGPARR